MSLSRQGSGRWLVPVSEVPDGDVLGTEGRDGGAVVEERGGGGSGFFAREGFEVVHEIAIDCSRGQSRILRAESA